MTAPLEGCGREKGDRDLSVEEVVIDQIFQ